VSEIVFGTRRKNRPSISCSTARMSHYHNIYSDYSFYWVSLVSLSRCY